MRWPTVSERGGQVVGLPRRRGDGEHEPAGSAGRAGGQRRDQQRAQRGRGDEVALADGIVRLLRERGRELGIFGYGGE